MQEYIKIHNARQNNLKGFDLQIPKRKITIFTGVSGSGKSSIVFDTIAQEAGRQLNENFSKFVQNFLPKYSQPEADAIDNLSMAVVVDQSRLGGNSRSTLGTITDINPLIRLLFSRIGTPYLGPAWNFSFNDPHGMCPACEGIGRIVGLNLDKALDLEKSLNEGAILLPGYKIGSWLLKSFTNTGFFDNDKPLKDYSKEEMAKFLYASGEKIDSLYMEGMSSTYEGLVARFNRSNIKGGNESSATTQKKIAAFMDEQTCPECQGKRFNQKVLDCKINDYSIADFLAMQLDELLEILSEITDEMIQPVLKNLQSRLQDLINIGLDYVSLNRETATLSGGESQRVKMVKHLSSSLNDVIYIFDEPSIGLHPRDVHRLNELLIKLRDKGNTVIVVEHDPDVIKVADHIIDVGPRAGKNGGHITYEGSYEGLLVSDTLTGKAFGQMADFKSEPRKTNDFIETTKSTLHNLKNTSLKVPLGVFTVVTGVAGSGKSSLVNGVFAKEYPEAITIDQSAVAGNIRSNPATYSGIMNDIRKVFSAENNVSAGLFSYNSEGACETCKGHGHIKMELSFMDSVEILCQACGGKRFKEEVYQYKLKEKSIDEVLAMSITEAVGFFEEKSIQRKLKQILEVGLGYMTLGQPLNTLSGGECQRLKLAKELSKKGNIYIMDEPTTGLHMADIKSILDIIERLVNKGNTVIVIEHNLEIMKAADWLIDVGIDGGIRGGEILYEGIPENISTCKQSITARYLMGV
ncbi:MULTISPECIES: ATP-binding cassette domain-containing protein [unclassified Enterococcus]|uniref:ATP-binding cassette domain-containing protein n=1 Tax=unclassified Enterococcus TaxID=2608891 RepID=UPI001A9123CC|nr:MULTISPECIES: excinuclease ABC subunit UvrA [unclassified Enterococcus]MBO0460481.1 excinuclease ABC subunit UvrA [Enterococcus sp. DIV1298c]MBO1299123.1 excinuclease ABC subunit UvrA [Enterococcus sp. DIV1271a]